jgi:hypothetical protein
LPARRFDPEFPATCSNTLAHAGQAVAALVDAAAAVVADTHHHPVGADDHRDLDPAGTSVALDVGDRLAQHQRHARLDLGRQFLWIAPVFHLHTGGLQQQPRRSQFGYQRRRPDTADRAAYLRQRITRHPLDVGDFTPRGTRIALDQAPGQFGFQRHHRQGVAEQIMQVSADAFALGAGGETANLVMRQAQFGVPANIRPHGVLADRDRKAEDRDPDGNLRRPVQKEGLQCPRQDHRHHPHQRTAHPRLQ